MKFLYVTILCAVLLGAAIAQEDSTSLEEKRNVKRDLLGVGYASYAPYGGLGYANRFGYGYYPAFKAYYGGWNPYRSSIGYPVDYLGYKYPTIYPYLGYNRGFFGRLGYY